MLLTFELVHLPDSVGPYTPASDRSQIPIVHVLLLLCNVCVCHSSLWLLLHSFVQSASQ